MRYPVPQVRSRGGSARACGSEQFPCFQNLAQTVKTSHGFNGFSSVVLGPDHFIYRNLAQVTSTAQCYPLTEFSHGEGKKRMEAESTLILSMLLTLPPHAHR